MKKLSMDELNRLSREEFVKSEKMPITVVLDNIRSLNNIGSVFRTSDPSVLNVFTFVGLQLHLPTAKYIRQHLVLQTL